MDPGVKGSIRYRTFGAAPNRHFAVEWTNVPLYYYSNYVRSFQTILYENGSIKFQYGPLVGTLGTPVIGVENGDGTQGKAWTAGVSNGMALLISVPSGAADADHDGLPDAWENFYFGANSAYNGASDPDHDGVSNHDEFRAGTDPTQATSNLRIDEFRLLSRTKGLVRWRGIPGKPYTLWAGAPGNWTKLTTNPVVGAASGTNYYTNSILSGASMLRLSTP